MAQLDVNMKKLGGIFKFHNQATGDGKCAKDF